MTTTTARYSIRSAKPSPTSSQSMPWLLGGLMILLLIVGISWWNQRKIYPPVSDAEGLHLIKLLYSACNQKNSALLTRFERELSAAAQAGKVSDTEQEMFRAISATAAAGDWQTAASQSLRFARDQRND